MKIRLGSIRSLLLASCLFVSGAAQAGEATGPGLASLEGKRVGILEGTVHGDAARAKLSGFTLLYYMTFTDLLAALRTGGVDAIIGDIPMLATAAASEPGLALIREKMQDGNYAFATNKERADLAERISGILRELNQDGTLKRLHAKWVTGPEAERVLPRAANQGGGGAVLRYGVADIGRPFVYQNADGELIGYDVELGMIVAEKLGMQLKLQEFLFAHLFQAVNNNLVDVIGSAVTVAPDREEEVKFTAPYFRSGSAAMVRSGR